MTTDLLPSPPFPATRHWKIAALWDYWIGVYRKLGRMPRRADIDPVDIPKLLPNIWLVDWEKATFRFRHRLVGTAVTRARSLDATGRYLDEDLPDFAASPLGRALSSVVAENRPDWNVGRPSRTRVPTEMVGVERLSLPLAQPDGGVAMVINLSIYTMRDGSEI